MKQKKSLNLLDSIKLDSIKATKLGICGLLAAFALNFNACENESTSLISNGTKSDEKALLAMQDADIESYAKVADIFQKTQNIQSNGKPYFLVFAANGCVYCEKLKDLIAEDSEIKTLLANYSPYYINTSYQKSHNIAFLGTLSTQELAQNYNIRPTPTLIFADKDGKTLLSYPGFVPKDRFKAMLEFLQTAAERGLNEEQSTQELAEIFRQKQI